MVLSKFANKSFFTRLISGIVLVALILVTIIPGGNILFFFNMFLSVAALYELYKVLGLENKLPGITGYIALIVYYALIYIGKEDYVITLLGVILICLFAEYVFMFPKYNTEGI